MQGFWRFLTYNNAVPIALTVLISGAGATFAATNPEAIYETTETVVSVDNTYLANKDLDSFTPRIEIVGVTEDEDNYYVAYRLTTIDIVDSVWQDVAKEDVLTVAKGVLGEYGDLGLYATTQFVQIVDRQVSYLKEVQDIERKQVSQKMVATSYSGLVGRFLDDSTATLPGYVPVVAPEPEPIVEVGTPSSEPGSQVAAAAQTQPSGGSAAPQIQILGDNPVLLQLAMNYADLGVVVTDDSKYQPIVRKFVNGVETTNELVTVDTSVPGEHVIRYEARDLDGNMSSAERRVIVADPNARPEPAPTEAATSTPPEFEPEPEPEPEEEPAPEELEPTPPAPAATSTASSTPAEE